MARPRNGKITLLQVEPGLIVHRDQELRFTVHDSSDYLRIKCSVFNDDKKTDLIGETWIDLRDLIITGGGQNDIWHQLQFKGKQAGEIRIEMTFYDTRPQSENAITRKRGKEKKQSDNGSQTTNGPRQLGPRDISRRPLPASPGGSAPSSAPSTPDALAPHMVRPLLKPTLPTPIRPLPADQRQDYFLASADSVSQSIPQTSRTGITDQHLLLSNCYLPGGADQSHYDTFEQHHREDWSNLPVATHNASHSSTQVSLEDLQGDGHAPSTHSPAWSEAPVTPQSYGSSLPFGGSSPPFEPQIATYGVPITSQPHRNLPSPSRSSAHRDSPLRQSMSHQDFQDIDPIPPLSPEGPAPRPPTHGLPRRPVQPLSSNDGHSKSESSLRNDFEASQAWRQSPLDDRSPLQAIDHNYTTKRDHHHAHQHSNPHVIGVHKVLPREPDWGRRDAYGKPARPGSGHENKPPSLWQRSDDGILPLEEPGSYNAAFEPLPRNDYRTHVPTTPWLPRGRNSYPGPASPPEQVYRSQPQIYRPRPISPHAYTPTRKSVNSLPASTPDPFLNTSSPFSPDSYDIVHQGPSLSANGRAVDATFSDAREAARQKEVENLRGQGPIIGNDGRVIDPSDHLPADTWAPEPERKNRKPEHVIRIRTKEDSARATSEKSTPFSQRGNAQSPPGRAFPPIDPPRNGPNKLHKAGPHRALPKQPLPHSYSSPNVGGYQDVGIERGPGEPQRPGLPVHTNSTPSPREGRTLYTSRSHDHYSSPHGQYNTSPLEDRYESRWDPGSANHSADFDYSSIDIGPSRIGRNSGRYGI